MDFWCHTIKRDRLDNKNLFSEQLNTYNFGLEKWKNWILLTSKSNSLKIFFLSILITNHKSNSFNFGEFEYVKNVELSNDIINFLLWQEI